MFVAKKPCNFAGKRFAIGEEIPEELIDSNRKMTLLKFGRIEQVETPENDDTKQTSPEDGENKPNAPVTAEGGENPQPKPEDGKTDVKKPLNGKQKAAGARPANKNKQQKGGK